MFLFDGLDFQTRLIKLRPRQTTTCSICSKRLDNDDWMQAKSIIDSFDYNHFCGVSAYNDKTLDVSLLDAKTQRIACNDYEKIAAEKEPHLLIDVRPQCQFEICSLPNSLSKLKDAIFYI